MHSVSNSNNQDRRITLVVLDSDLTKTELVAAFFRPKGFTVLCVSSAAEFLSNTSVPDGLLHILLTDYSFSDMSASEFSKRVAITHPGLPVVALSSGPPPPIAATESQTQSYPVYSLPIDFALLRVEVAHALDFLSLTHPPSPTSTVPASSLFLDSPIGANQDFLAALKVAGRAARSMACILLTGESGTGKEVFARFIHRNSRVAIGPFVPINCSAIPENLLESELFGHARGSFTGALTHRVGLFESAENGTLFLDEIGDLGLPLQAKLLRVLQERKIKRVGENTDRRINCRIVCATHMNLNEEIGSGRFRQDLFFRINVIPITIPPLRERPDDILTLAHWFLRRFVNENSSSVERFSDAAMETLVHYTWPGNVRELQNCIERAVVLCGGVEIGSDGLDLIPGIPGSTNSPSSPERTPRVVEPTKMGFQLPYTAKLPTLDQVIHHFLIYAIEQNGGARDKAARDIGIDRKTLYRRMRGDHLSEDSE